MSCAGAAWLAAFVVFVGTLIIRHNDLPAATDVRVALGTAVLALLSLAGPVARLVRSEFVVTRSHLFARAGWRAPAMALALRDVAQVDVERGALGRYLDYGTIPVAARNDDVVVFHHVAAPGTLREAMGGGLAARR